MKRLLLILIVVVLTSSKPIYEVPIKASVLRDSEYIMLSQVGLQEKHGRNDGEHIRQYHKVIGLAYSNTKTNYPYCMMGQAWFIWVANDSSFKGIETIKTAGTRKAFNNFKNNGTKRLNGTPQVGDFIFWTMPRSVSGHVERIIRVINEVTFETVGCNTSNGKTGSQREGNGNFKRIRRIDTRLGSLCFLGFGGWKVINDGVVFVPYCTYKDK